MFRNDLRNLHLPVLSMGAAFLLSVLLLSPLHAQTEASKSASDRAHIEDVLRGLNRGRNFGQVAISPDGKKLAWIDGGRGGAEISVASPAVLTKSQRVTAAASP